MPDFNNNDEDFENDDEFEANLQLNQPDKDDEFRLDGDDDEDEEDDDEDEQIKKLKQAAAEINAEADRLREIQSALAKAKTGAASHADGAESDGDDDMGDNGLNAIPGLGIAREDSSKDASNDKSSSPSKAEDGEEAYVDPAEADARSIFAKNVDYSSEAGEINAFFSSCGAIERLTILTDKMTGRPKGCAYVQFKSKEAVETALALDGSTFKGRVLSIAKKHRTLPPHKLYPRRRRRRRRRYYGYGYGYVPYYPRRRRRSWAPY